MSVTSKILLNSTKDSRGCHGSVGEVVRAVHAQAPRCLLWGRDTVMLYMAILEIRIESLKIDKVRDIRVSSGTMVAFIEVVCENLPVEISFQLVRVVELVIVKVDVLIPFLLVDVGKVFFPRDFGYFFCIHVYPDEAVDIDFNVNAKEAVLLFLIAFEILIAWCLGKVAIETVRPAVISACKNLGIAFLLLDNGISTMSADIVEGIHSSSTITIDDDIVPSNFEAKEVSSILNA